MEKADAEKPAAAAAAPAPEPRPARSLSRIPSRRMHAQPSTLGHMFIYKFMSGLVETMTGGDEEEEYDPHKHRIVEKPTSYADTMIHLLKASCGAGILAMPDAMSRVGLLYGVIGVAIIGVIATYSIQLLIASQYLLCKQYRRGYMAYPKSLRLALLAGPSCLHWSASFFYYFVDVVLIVWQFGLCVIYPVFVAENIKQVCDYYGAEASLRLHLCYLLVPLLLISMVKDLKLMTPLSSISNVVTIFGLILVFFYLVEDDVVIDDEKLKIKGLMEIPVFVAITLFALEAVGVILALEYNMESPKEFVGLFGLFNIGMVIIMALYTLVGLFGYLKYGDQIKASITLNLPFEQKKAQAAKIIFAVAIFLSFPLQNYVAYNIIWRRLKKRLTTTRRWVIDYTIRVLLVVGPWLVALAVPQLGPFISLFGAFCLTLLGIIFPGMIDACLMYPDQYGFCWYKLLRDVLIIVVGFAALVSGCYTSILEIIDAF